MNVDNSNNSNNSNNSSNSSNSSNNSNSSNDLYQQMHNLAREIVINCLSNLYSSVYSVLPPDDRVTDLLSCKSLLMSAMRQYINQTWSDVTTNKSKHNEHIQAILKCGHIQHLSCLFSIVSILAHAMIKYIHSFVEKHHLKDMSLETFSTMVGDILDVVIVQNIERLKQESDKTYVCSDKCQLYDFKEGEDFIRSPYTLNKI